MITNPTAIATPFKRQGFEVSKEELLNKLETLMNRVKAYKRTDCYARHNIPEAREEDFRKLKAQFDALNESLWEEIIEED